MISLETERVTVFQITEQQESEMQDIVAREFPLTIIFNKEELVTLLCTPTKLKYLAIGYLASEGMLKDKKDIKSIILKQEEGVIRLETKGMGYARSEVRFIASGGGKMMSFYSTSDSANHPQIESMTKIVTSQIFELMMDFQERSKIYKITGGVHSAALSDGNRLLLFSEDIGRHNAIDKIFGECLWKDIPTSDKVILTTGRVSLEILLKVAKRDIPIIISKSAPTNMAVKAASEMGITLIGFVRGRRMSIYTHSDRIRAKRY